MKCKDCIAKEGETQPNSLRVLTTTKMIDWIREQAHASMDRYVRDSRYPGKYLNIEKELEEQFGETILFALRVGMLLEKEEPR